MKNMQDTQALNLVPIVVEQTAREIGRAHV